VAPPAEAPKEQVGPDAEKLNTVMIPSYTSWFDLGKTHPIESRALPEFFNNRSRSKTIAVYKEYRAFMIETYRLRPAQYLTITACRRSLAGDVCAIARVHAFLEHWGLINYDVDNDTRPIAVNSVLSLAGRTVITEGVDGQEQLTRKTDGGAVATVVSFDDSWLNRPGPLNLATRRNVFAEPRAALLVCATCSKKVLAAHYKTQATGSAAALILCPQCFHDGKYASNFSSDDFTRVENERDSNALTNSSAWTEEETLTLLEALDKYGDSWADVVRHVGGDKTVEQCVTHFLQMPIEDPYMDAQFRTNIRSADGVTAPAAPTAVMPFQNMENPVLAQVAFLSHKVNPQVAAAAAQAALKVFVAAHENEEGKPVEEVSAEGSPQEGESLNQATQLAAAAAGVAAAAGQANVLAEVEGNSIRQLVLVAIEKQLEKLQFKVAQFNELEEVVSVYQRQVEQERAALHRERLAMAEAKRKAEAPPAPAEVQSNIGVATSVTGVPVQHGNAQSVHTIVQQVQQQPMQQPIQQQMQQMQQPMQQMQQPMQQMQQPMQQMQQPMQQQPQQPQQFQAASMTQNSL